MIDEPETAVYNLTKRVAYFIKIRSVFPAFVK